MRRHGSKAANPQAEEVYDKSPQAAAVVDVNDDELPTTPPPKSPRKDKFNVNNGLGIGFPANVSMGLVHTSRFW